MECSREDCNKVTAGTETVMVRNLKASGCQNTKCQTVLVTMAFGRTEKSMAVANGVQGMARCTLDSTTMVCGMA